MKEFDDHLQYKPLSITNYNPLNITPSSHSAAASDSAWIALEVMKRHLCELRSSSSDSDESSESTWYVLMAPKHHTLNGDCAHHYVVSYVRVSSGAFSSVARRVRASVCLLTAASTLFAKTGFYLCVGHTAIVAHIAMHCTQTMHIASAQRLPPPPHY